MRLLWVVLCSLLSFPVWAASPEELMALDALYVRRVEPAAVTDLEKALREALKAAPEDFELLWRAARIRVWRADGTEDDRRKRVLARQAWELAERAVKQKPERVEGHFYAAVSIGAYSQAVGILKALSEGLEGKFNTRLEKALKLDPGFDHGGPLLAHGRYYYELPWPKRDLKKALSLIQDTLTKHPESLRAWLYLAEALLADDEPKKAQEAVLRVMQGSVAYDQAEGQRVQAWAKQVQTEIQEELE